MHKFFASLPLVQGLGVAITTTSALIFIVLIGYIYTATSQNAILTAEKNIFKEAELIHDQMVMFDDELEAQASRLIDLFKAAFPEAITMDANQPEQTGSQSLPGLFVGSELINNQTTQIDYLSRLGGDIPASFFVRNGNQFVRVASTLKREDGSRSTGSALDSSHPGHANLINGKDYIGRAKLFGKDYMAAYHPIKDKTGTIIAVIAIAFDFSEKLAELKGYLSNLDVGERSYVFVMDAATGGNQGNLIIHPFLEGKNLSNTQDADGGYPFKNMLENKEGYLTYNFNEKDGVHSKLLAYKRFEKWNWAMGIIGYAEDAMAATVKIRNTIIIMAILSLLLLTGVSFFVIRQSLKPMQIAEKEMSKIGAGDLRTDNSSLQFQENSKNEIDHLLSGQQKMRSSLRELIEGLHNDISNMRNASSSLEEVVEKNNRIVEEQNDSAALVVSSMSEMVDSIKDIAKSAAETSADTKAAMEAVSDGRSLMDKSNQITLESASEMTQITDVIEKLHEESLNIGNILDVIRGVAEQTNLLALNAAIEAARAGEQGRGFAVVADEVRNLAKTTQDSTLQIQNLIEGLQSSAKTAVDKATQAGEINQKNVEFASRVHETLDTVASNTASINDKITQIASTAEEQNAVAIEIESNIGKLKNASDRSSASAAETSDTGQGIKQLSEGLDQKVSSFTL